MIMAKAKERLDAEAKLNMTKKQKIQNFWFYYRIHVIATIGAVIMLGVLIYDIMSQVESDYTLGLITAYPLTQETLIGMQDAINEIADDRNEDGEVVVTLSHYQMAIEENADPMMQMAATTRLSGDISVSASMIYMIDTPESYMPILEGMFTYNDGTPLPASGAVDVENLGYSLEDISAFNDIYGIDRLENVRVVMVNQKDSRIEKDEDLMVYYEDSLVIYENLKA